MAWGVRWYLVGSIVLGILGVLAGCSGSMFFAEREPWRHDAEVQCLKTGAVKEGAGITRVGAIRGPGICGADFPLKVSILGESAPLGYSGDLRPPGDIPRSAPRWPIRPAPAPAEPPYQSRVLPDYQVRSSPAVRRDLAPDQPVSLNPPGIVDAPNVAAEPYDFRKPYGATPAAPARRYQTPAGSPREDFSPEPYERRPLIDAPPTLRNGSTGVTRAPLREPLAETPRASAREPAVPLGRSRDSVPTTFTPVSITPPATLACPIVSELERWITGTVQPAAMRWFGSPVAEIRQISAYSCRGMNGNPRASISEHAFGNALDIASFTLADGRKITVKNGWHGSPEEQGFLRDVHAAACDQFSTVLAPGSNVYHYDHIHVDLMRRRDGHRACNPHAVSGEEAAARAARYAGKRDPGITGSVTPRRWFESRRAGALPIARPGEDGEDD
jgi:Extensin-like protein C-terminus